MIHAIVVFGQECLTFSEKFPGNPNFGKEKYLGNLVSLVLTIIFDISDDPYYCGLRARVPNFVNGKQQQQQQGQPGHSQGKDGGKPNSKSSNSKNHTRGNNPSALSPPPSRSTPNLQNLAQLPGAAPPFWWHSRLYPDSGIGGNHIFSTKDTLILKEIANS